MPFIIRLTIPGEEEYFASLPDLEGLRYRTTKRETAEIFNNRADAERAIVGIKQIRELQKYQIDIEEM